jgi:hypothetical protein
MRLTSLCLGAAAVSPSVSRTQPPVFRHEKRSRFRARSEDRTGGWSQTYKCSMSRRAPVPNGRTSLASATRSSDGQLGDCYGTIYPAKGQEL